MLDPPAAQTVALALHELATNAAKYGALALASGRIRADWGIDAGSLILDWAETDGPPVVAPSTRGYGMRVINASIEQLGGKVRFDWEQGGVRCRLSIPVPDETRQRHARHEAQPSTQNSPAESLLLSDNDNVLVVEDESLVAMMMVEALTEMGLSIVGPFSTTVEAIRAVNDTPVAAAILDINLGDELVYPVADLLTLRGIPFAFITGYGSGQPDSRYPQAQVLLKPVDPKVLREVLGKRGPIGQVATA